MKLNIFTSVDYKIVITKALCCTTADFYFDYLADLEAISLLIAEIQRNVMTPFVDNDLKVRLH